MTPDDPLEKSDENSVGFVLDEIEDEPVEELNHERYDEFYYYEG